MGTTKSPSARQAAVIARAFASLRQATGTIAVFRIYKSDGTSIVASGTVTLTGGGGDIELDDLTIGSVGQTVEIPTITFVQS